MGNIAEELCTEPATGFQPGPNHDAANEDDDEVAHLYTPATREAIAMAYCRLLEAFDLAETSHRQDYGMSGTNIKSVSKRVVTMATEEGGRAGDYLGQGSLSASSRGSCHSRRGRRLQQVGSD